MSINRRGFLKLVAGAGVAGAAATVGAPQAKASEDFTGHPDRFGVLCDLSKCIGCRSCEEACDQVNELGKDPTYFADEKVMETTRRSAHNMFTFVNKFQPTKDGQPDGGPVFVKNQCMHCDEPACFSACLAKAFDKTPEGAVVYNSWKCIGCRYCMQACPFYIPAYEYHEAFTPRVRKCTMCYDRIKEGGVPGCVEICPMDAIIFGKRSDLLKIATKRLLNDGGYEDHIYGQYEVGGTCWMYISKKPFDQLGFKMNLGTTALPKLTYGYLATIPVMHITLPIILAGFYAITKGRKNGQDKGVK